MRFARILGSMGLAFAGCSTGPETPVDGGIDVPPALVGQRLPDSPGIRRVIQLEPDLFQGSAPQGEEGLASLKTLGIRTIVSVDGDVPPYALAKKIGLAYIHAPIPYSGIPPAVRDEFLAAMKTTPGPTYVHCHAGRHRSSAMTALLQVAARGKSAEWARGQMLARGCSREYAGLFRDVERAAAAAGSR